MAELDERNVKGPQHTWFTVDEIWLYVKQAYEARKKSGEYKFPKFRVSVNQAGDDPDLEKRMELSSVAKWLLNIKNTPRQIVHDVKQSRK